MIPERTYGHAGIILHVDLSQGSHYFAATGDYAARFIGGRGVNNWLTYSLVPPGTAPLSADNCLILGTGTLVGTLAPGASRHSVDAMSPVTGGIGSANSCGHFSAELKYAGFDHIVFHGESPKPVFLQIDDDKIALLDASHLMGLTASATTDAIEQQIGRDYEIAVIGPAGENLALSACVITNRARAAGRCGLGAVMGSKRLKAVAVRGSGTIRVAAPVAFMEAVGEAWDKLKNSAATGRRQQWGTMWSGSVLNDMGLFPSRNFQDDHIDPQTAARLGPQIFRDNHETGRIAYTACPVACSHRFQISEGPYAGLTCEGFEANDLMNFGGRLGIDYPPAIIQAHYLCNEYGLDQDNTVGAIAWAFECFEKGILTTADTGGLALNWGDHRVVMELLRQMAHREGIGDLLADGSYRAAQRLGRNSAQYVIHIKGQDSMEPMRGAKGWALGCVVSTRGGSHTRGANLAELYQGLPIEFYRETWGIDSPGDMLSYQDKAGLVVYYERLQAVVDSLGMCLFTSNWGGADLLGPTELARLYSTATGIQVTAAELMLAGERIHNVEKAFNVRHAGFARQDDQPPARFIEEPVTSGPTRGERLEPTAWNLMLDDYYARHGWDITTGWQRRVQLTEIGLAEVADDLAAVGRLALDQPEI
jgi:aldehyde:ferredoxin oxidoreductase